MSNLFAPTPLQIAVTGSRGLIGSALVPFLLDRGHRVVRLVSDRSPPKDDGTIWRTWDAMQPLDPQVLSGTDAVVHLAGDSIAEGRWTAAKKARIRDSRIIPTRHLAEAAAAAGVKIFLSGSAVGIYGDRGEIELPESAAIGRGFLPEVAAAWEAAARRAESSARVVNLRTGIVLARAGGALAKQLPAFKLGAGAVLGSGRQFLPWIGLNDIVAAIHHILTTDACRGPINSCAPVPVPNRFFGRTLAKVLRRPFLLTLPAGVLRLMFGEMADAALLSSTRAVPAQLLATGFHFAEPDLENCLRAELNRSLSHPGMS